jgi:hypothetical protein
MLARVALQYPSSLVSQIANSQMGKNRIQKIAMVA